MSLLKDPVVKGISVFNPIAKDDFSGRRYPGGVFLGRGIFSDFSGGVLFYDESRELSRILDPLSSVQSIQIKTRNLVPGKVTSYLIEELRPFLVGCEKELLAFFSKSQELEKKVLSHFTKKKAVIYFLGEYRSGRPPEMLIVNDGIVKWLVENKKILTYPSELAYVNWSAKILKTLPKKTRKIAVKDSGDTMEKRVYEVDDFTNLVFPGALVPGITQLEAWDYLMSKIIL